MAAASASLLRVVGSQSRRSLLTPNVISSLKPNVGVRFITKSECGAILPKPPQVRFGLIKQMSVFKPQQKIHFFSAAILGLGLVQPITVALTVTPFLLGGATISREFAAWLEEHELFVPDDDDD